MNSSNEHPRISIVLDLFLKRLVFPEVKYVVECDVMVEPLCDRRDNRIDHILNNTELKRETELLLSVKYLYGYDVRRLAIHLEEPRNNVLDITL